MLQTLMTMTFLLYFPPESRQTYSFFYTTINKYTFNNMTQISPSKLTTLHPSGLETQSSSLRSRQTSCSCSSQTTCSPEQALDYFIDQIIYSHSLNCNNFIINSRKILDYSIFYISQYWNIYWYNYYYNLFYYNILQTT